MTKQSGDYSNQGNNRDNLRIPYKRLDIDVDRYFNSQPKDFTDGMREFVRDLDQKQYKNWIEVETWIKRNMPQSEYLFCFPGAVANGQSVPTTVNKDFGLVYISAVLRVAGSSKTVINIQKNTTNVQTITINSSVNIATIALQQPIIFSKDTDILNAQITTSGTGATDLTVHCRMAA